MSVQLIWRLIRFYDKQMVFYHILHNITDFKWSSYILWCIICRNNKWIKRRVNSFKEFIQKKKNCMLEWWLHKKRRHLKTSSCPFRTFWLINCIFNKLNSCIVFHLCSNLSPFFILALSDILFVIWILNPMALFDPCLFIWFSLRSLNVI